MAWLTAVTDINIFIKELCCWWSKLKLVKEVHLLLAFWKAQVAGEHGLYFKNFFNFVLHLILSTATLLNLFCLG